MADEQTGLRQLLEKIYRQRGFDFREYRKSTLTRRIGRRLRVTGAVSYEQYGRILDRSPQEFNRLFDDLTINVTSFFRDEPAFRALKEVVLPELLNGRGKQKRDIRVWSAGCATGEEPYSVTILLLEFLGSKSKEWKIRVLGTDVDPKAIDKARRGFFARADVEGLGPELLKKHFSQEGERFKVKQGLKRLVTFEEHSLLADPPCAGQDLVLCRNVLIYFTSTLQVRVLKHLYKGVRQGGFLFLGKAEVPVGETRKLFRCVDNKAKLYQKVSRVQSAEFKMLDFIFWIYCGFKKWKELMNLKSSIINHQSKSWSSSPPRRGALML